MAILALLSAAFALTAIFAKFGVEHVHSDCAIFIRPIPMLLVLGAVLTGTGRQPIGSVAGSYALCCPDSLPAPHGSAISVVLS